MLRIGFVACCENKQQYIMNNNNELAKSMEATLEKRNLDYLGDLGEIAIDAVLDEGLLTQCKKQIVYFSN